MNMGHLQHVSSENETLYQRAKLVYQRVSSINCVGWRILTETVYIYDLFKLYIYMYIFMHKYIYICKHLFIYIYVVYVYQYIYLLMTPCGSSLAIYLQHHLLKLMIVSPMVPLQITRYPTSI